MKYALTTVLILVTLSIQSESSLFESDSCYSFGSGNVFPGGARKIDHKLQVTKAVSKYNTNQHYSYLRKYKIYVYNK